MSIIPLTTRTVQTYMGAGKASFNFCHEISKIHVTFSLDDDYDDNSIAEIEARIPGSSTRTPFYVISVSIQMDASRHAHISQSRCTCPIGYRCKHINKVLHRIADSQNRPIPPPDREQVAREARRNRIANLMDRGANVYIALACKSEVDSGSDYGRSYHIKESFDQEILGVFFSAAPANQCAKDYVHNDLGYEEDEEEFELDEEEVGDYYFDSSDTDVFGQDDYVDKVWVESRAIEDASQHFHP